MATIKVSPIDRANEAFDFKQVREFEDDLIKRTLAYNRKKHERLNDL